MSSRRRLFYLSALVPALVIASCKSPSEVCSDPAICGDAVATTVSVTPGSATLSIGETQQLSATVRDQGGNVMSGAAVTWSAPGGSAASVSTSGLVTAESAGMVTITATSGSASGTAAITVTDPCDPVGSLAVGDDGAGTLSATDCDLQDGHTGDIWNLEVTTSGRVQIDLISDSFDGVLGLLDTGGNLITDADDSHFTGDGPYDLNPHIDMTLDAGSYFIVATSFDPGETGPYQLFVGPGLPCSEIGALAPGESANSALDAGDCSYDGFYAEPYAVHITTAGSYTFDLTSVDFDAYMTLYDPSGNFIAFNDDLSDATFDSRIVISLDPGWYVVEASSFDVGEVGNYTLSVN